MECDKPDWGNGRPDCKYYRTPSEGGNGCYFAQEYLHNGIWKCKCNSDHLEYEAKIKDLESQLAAERQSREDAEERGARLILEWIDASEDACDIEVMDTGDSGASWDNSVPADIEDVHRRWIAARAAKEG